jgi:hypothetical protein
MMEDDKLYGIEKPEGGLLPVIEKTEVEAMQAGAEMVFESAAAGKIGRLMLAGYKIVEVKLVKA